MGGKLWYRLRCALARLGFIRPGKIMYIGGSDTLPAPLSRQEEAEVIGRLANGEKSAKNILIERNLRLVVYSKRWTPTIRPKASSWRHTQANALKMRF